MQVVPAATQLRAHTLENVQAHDKSEGLNASTAEIWRSPTIFKSSDDKCSSIYPQRYGMPLPHAPIAVLTPIILALSPASGGPPRDLGRSLLYQCGFFYKQS